MQQTDNRAEQTFAEFVEKHGVEIQSVEAPRTDGIEWDSRASHWAVTVSLAGRGDTFGYSMGSACRYFTKYIRGFRGQNYSKGARVPVFTNNLTVWESETLDKWTAPDRPELSDVLYCLVLDMSSAEDLTVDEFAEEFGYTKPSQAIRAYNACVEMRVRLRRLFGAALCDELSECVEES